MRKLNTESVALPNFKRIDSVDGTIYGAHNKVMSVNPHKCRFVATYSNGIEVPGKNLFDTGWDALSDGIVDLRYELSTGHVIKIPRAKGYKPLIEVSLGLDNSRIFHYINVNTLQDKEVVIYKIVLRQDSIQPYKIGDVIMSKAKLPDKLDSGWKFSNYGGTKLWL